MMLSRETEQCPGIPHCSEINSANEKGKEILRSFSGEHHEHAVLADPSFTAVQWPQQCALQVFMGCRKWDTWDAIIDPSSKGLGFLPSPCQFSSSCGPKKSWCGRARGGVVGCNRCISVAVWEETVSEVEMGVRRNEALKLSAHFSAEACKSPWSIARSC